MNQEQQINIDEGSMWGTQQDSIMSMRWENKELLTQLWKNLAYMDVKYVEGRAILYRDPKDKTTPPLNPAGAKAIINVIHSVVNTVGSLSKIHQEHAMILVKHIKALTRRIVAVKGKEYGCTRRVDRQLVLQIVENITFLQLMRPVGGHESNHSRLNFVERREDVTATSNNSKGWNPFRSNKQQGE